MWSIEFLNETNIWEQFTANSGIVIQFGYIESAKSIAKFVAISDNRFPTNFLSWRIVSPSGEKSQIF